MPAQLTDEQWSNLCDGCGQCCNLGRTGVACPGLDCSSNTCTVYEKRTKTEMCVQLTPSNVPRMYADGVLPATCGYVRYQLLGIPYADARLDFMKGTAKLIPFNLANPTLQADYLSQRKVWFARIETMQEEQS